MTYTETQNWKVAIHESKNSEKIIAFDSSGWGMSDRWWKQTFELQQNGMLHGVYQTLLGLRRTTI